MKTLVKNAANEDQVKEAKLREKYGRDREVEDVRSILSSVYGRRFIWRYLDVCGVFKTSFTGSSQTFYLEGQRNIGLKILADINEANPDAFVQMMKESKGDL
jgi:hypothetical protein